MERFAVEGDGVHEPGGDPDWPYAPPAARPGRPVELLAIAYAFWGNRGASAMRVWMPQSS